MITMVTDVTPAQPADLSGLTIEQIAALPTIKLAGLSMFELAERPGVRRELLARVLPEQPSVPVAAFNSSI